MKKEFKDYVPFYLGCECITLDGIMVLNGINTTDVRYSVWFYCKWNDKKNCYLPKQNGEILGKQSLAGKAYKYSDIKLVLRPLSDMTDEEKNEFEVFSFEVMKEDLNQVERNALKTKWYLEKHFDLFGLIEAGLAIDKTTLK